MNKRISTLMALFTSTAIVSVACTTGTAPVAKQTTPDTVDLLSLPKNNQGYRQASADQLASALKAKNFTLINVHIPYAGEIPQTDALVPFNDIQNNLDQFPADKNTPVAVYCHSGSMGASASKTLVDLGYINIIDISGGMKAWQKTGGTLVNR